MTKQDWALITKRYKVALDICKQTFQKEYLEDWRSHIQDHNELVRFFKRWKIEILVGEKGFELKTQVLTLRKKGYRNRAETERKALITCFRILNINRGQFKVFN